MKKVKTIDAQRRPSALIENGSLSPTIEFWDVTKALRKRFLLIAFVGLASLGSTLYYLYNTTPTYTAFGQILLGEQGLSDQNAFDLIEAQALSSSVIEGEIAVMRSDELLALVVRQLDLQTDIEFNAELQSVVEPNPAVDWLKNFVRGIFAPDVDVSEEQQQAGGSGGGLNEEIQRASSANQQSMGEVGGVVGYVRRSLFIRQQGTSFILSVQMTSENPRKAAAIANTVMDQYVYFIANKRYQAALRFTGWLESRVEELAKILEASEREVLAFRGKMEADIDSGVRLDQQMQEFTTKLVNARAELAEAQAQAQRANDIYESNGAVATINVLSNDATLEFSREMSKLRQEEATAIESFSSNSTQVTSIRRAISKIEEDITTEVENLLLQLENRVQVLSINVSALESSLRSFEGLNLQRSNELIRLNQLERIADANRRVYQDFLGRFKETSEFQDLQSSDAEVLAYASPPASPSYPRKRVSAILSLLGGLGLGAALAVALEMRTKKLTSTRQISSKTGLPVFGSLPKRGTRANLVTLLNSITTNPDTNLAKAARALGNNVRIHTSESQRATFVTSSEPNKGKSLTAVMLAWSVVQSGKTCILVDGDIRMNNLTESLNKNSGSGFLDAIYGDAPLDICINTDKNLGFDFLPTQTLNSDPVILYGADSTQKIIDQLSEMYDVVVIDAPALESPSDAFSSPGSNDLGVFTVPSGKVSLRQLTAELNIFDSLNLASSGIIMTNSS